MVQKTKLNKMIKIANTNLAKLFSFLALFMSFEFLVSSSSDVSFLGAIHLFPGMIARGLFLAVQFRFSQKGSQSLPKFTAENFKNIWLESGCLTGVHF